jgi:hypothetical protein
MGNRFNEGYADNYYDVDYDFYNNNDRVATLSTDVSGSIKVGGKFKTCGFKIQIHCRILTGI